MFDLAPDIFIQVRGVIQRFKRLKIKPAAFSHYLYPWAAKQALSIWYEKTNTIFDANGSITIFWMDPKTINQSEKVRSFLAGLPDAGSLAQGKFNVDTQFSYRTGITDDKSMGVYWAVFHETLTFVALLDTDATRATKLDRKAFKTSAVLRTNLENGIFIDSMGDISSNFIG
tara:strand:- start:7307 stop:7822 length:516 start_codon:yes stop_codon:yes gene_type:complete